MIDNSKINHEFLAALERGLALRLNFDEPYWFIKQGEQWSIVGMTEEQAKLSEFELFRVELPKFIAAGRSAEWLEYAIGKQFPELKSQVMKIENDFKEFYRNDGIFMGKFKT